jgi:hypothetical protein
MMSVSSIPLSQFRPANFTGLPDSHHPEAWLEALATNTPSVSNEASKFFLYFMIRRSEIIVGGSELSRAAQAANETHGSNVDKCLCKHVERRSVECFYCEWR